MYLLFITKQFINEIKINLIFYFLIFSYFMKFDQVKRGLTSYLSSYYDCSNDIGAYHLALCHLNNLLYVVVLTILRHLNILLLNIIVLSNRGLPMHPLEYLMRPTFFESKCYLKENYKC